MRGFWIVASGLQDLSAVVYWMWACIIDSYVHDGMSYEPSLCELATDPSVINIIRVIKPRKIRWAGQVARMLARRGV